MVAGIATDDETKGQNVVTAEVRQMGVQHLTELLARRAVTGRRRGCGVEPAGRVTQRFEVDPALVPEIVKEQTLCDTGAFGDVTGRNVIEVTSREVFDGSFYQLATRSLSLLLPPCGGPRRLSSQFGVAGSHR